MAAVLLRRIMDANNGVVAKIDVGSQMEIRKQVLHTVQTGTHSRTTRKVFIFYEHLPIIYGLCI